MTAESERMQPEYERMEQARSVAGSCPNARRALGHEVVAIPAQQRGEGGGWRARRRLRAVSWARHVFAFGGHPFGYYSSTRILYSAV